MVKRSAIVGNRKALVFCDWKLLAWKARDWLARSRGILSDWFREHVLLSLVGPELETGSH